MVDIPFMKIPFNFHSSLQTKEIRGGFRNSQKRSMKRATHIDLVVFGRILNLLEDLPRALPS